MIEFKAWPKTPRLFRDIVVTEKLDGTNAAIIVEKGFELDAATLEAKSVIAQVSVDGQGCAVHVAAQSRNRLITPGKDTDNYGFAGWVQENAESLALALGEGRHYGEWWGKGVARNYNHAVKVFSLFNTARYANIDVASMGLLDVVPTLYTGPNTEVAVHRALGDLRNSGSYASPGFMNPEGVCVFHTASNQVYKVLIENDEIPKGMVAA